MQNARENFITTILGIAIIFILSITIYFCLDIFGVIQVPQEYSLANLLFSKMEVVTVAGQYVENIIPNQDIVENTDSSLPNSNKDFETENSTIVVTLPNVQSAYQTPEDVVTVNNTLNSNECYYNQLDQYGKIIYDELRNNKEKLKTGMYTINFGTRFDDLLHTENGQTILNNAFQLAVNAFSFDEPDIFYIDITKIYLLTEITTRIFSKTYRVSVGSNGESYLYNEFSTEAIVNSAIAQVEEKKNYIKNAVSNESLYDQIRYVHNFLIDNIEYDKTFELSNIYNVYGALVNGKSVCEGYAKAFKYILDDMGIPCIIACGIAQNSSGETESHAWNYVHIDGNWYAIDVTWDDPIIIGSGSLTNDLRYSYFLKGSEQFFKDHQEDGTIIDIAHFVYPEISPVDY